MAKFSQSYSSVVSKVQKNNPQWFPDFMAALGMALQSIQDKGWIGSTDERDRLNNLAVRCNVQNDPDLVYLLQNALNIKYDRRFQ